MGLVYMYMYLWQPSSGNWYNESLVTRRLKWYRENSVFSVLWKTWGVDIQKYKKACHNTICKGSWNVETWIWTVRHCMPVEWFYRTSKPISKFHSHAQQQLKVKTSGRPLDNQTWQTDNWKTAPLAKVVWVLKPNFHCCLYASLIVQWPARSFHLPHDCESGLCVSFHIKLLCPLSYTMWIKLGTGPKPKPNPTPNTNPKP